MERLIYRKCKNSLIVLGLISFFILSIFSGTAGAGSSDTRTLDYTEGGHLETDFDTYFMSEWWYLNGKASLIAEDDETEDIGFFVVLGHTESPSISIDGIQLSHLASFHGLYLDDGITEFEYEETFIPRSIVGNFIAIHTPYVSYVYPSGFRVLSGSANSGYYLNYVSEKLTLNIFFQPSTYKTIDHAYSPLNFTAYERAYGEISGSAILRGEEYQIASAEGYMDHMISVSRGMGTWPMEIHGWNWFEVTTEKYQAVLYAIRGLEDGYDGYSYKHLTILNRNNGKVIAEYSGDEVIISENDWILEATFNRIRPSEVTVSTNDGTIVYVEAELVNNFDTPFVEPTGFVDFMAYQPDGAVIRYKGKTETGSSFYEYLVSDFALLLGS